MNMIQRWGKQALFIAPVIASGAIVTGAITSIVMQSVQPLAVSAEISLLATAIGIVVGQIFRWLGIAVNNGEQNALALVSSGVAYIGLCIARMATGLLPGGLLGVAALVVSLVTSVLIIEPYFKWLSTCLQLRS